MPHQKFITFPGQYLKKLGRSVKTETSNNVGMNSLPGCVTAGQPKRSLTEPLPQDCFAGIETRSASVGLYKMTSSIYPNFSVLSILEVVRLWNGPSVSSSIAFRANPIMAKTHLTRRSAFYSSLLCEPVHTHFSTYSLVFWTWISFFTYPTPQRSPFSA